MFIAITSLVCLPIYIAKISPDFGLLSIIWSSIAICSIFDFGISRSLTQSLGSITNEVGVKEYNSLVINGTFIAIIYSTIGGIIGQFAILKYLEIANFQLSIHANYIKFIGPIIFFNNMCNVFKGMLDGMHLVGRSTVLRILNSIGYLVAPILYMHYTDRYSIDSILYILLLSKVSQFFVCIVFIFTVKNFRFIQLSKRVMANLMLQGNWLTLSSIMSIVMVNSDRLIIGLHSTPKLVGIYALASELVLRGGGIFSIISSSLFPLVSRKKEQVGNEYMKHTLRINLIISVVVIIVGYIFVDDILKIWLQKTDMHDVGKLLRIMIIGWAAMGFGSLYLADIHGSGDTKTPAIIHTTEMIIFTPILYYCTYHYGAYGAAYTWTLRCIVDAIVLRYLYRKKRLCIHQY